MAMSETPIDLLAPVAEWFLRFHFINRKQSIEERLELIAAILCR